MKGLLFLTALAVGLSLPATLELPICSKGTVVDLNTGKSVCVGTVIGKRYIDIEEIAEICSANPRWTGVIELHIDTLDCY